MALRPRFVTGLPFRGMTRNTEASYPTAKLQVSRNRGFPRGRYVKKLDRKKPRVKSGNRQKPFWLMEIMPYKNRYGEA
jgi:hypothetical protein